MLMRCHEDTMMVTYYYGLLWTACVRGRIWGDDDSLHRDCLGDISQEEWLGCRYDTSPMVDIPKSTLVWAQYMVFFDLINIKNL